MPKNNPEMYALIDMLASGGQPPMRGPQHRQPQFGPAMRRRVQGVEQQMMDEQGGAPIGSDSDMAERTNRLATQVDPETPGKKAVAALGLSGDPRLSELWDNLPPEQRMMIVEVLNQHVGMIGAEDIEDQIIEQLAGDEPPQR